MTSFIKLLKSRSPTILLILPYLSDRPNRLLLDRQTVERHFFCKCRTKRELEKQKNFRRIFAIARFLEHSRNLLPYIRCGHRGFLLTGAVVSALEALHKSIKFQKELVATIEPCHFLNAVTISPKVR
jgi:hypothetical protein